MHIGFFPERYIIHPQRKFLLTRERESSKECPKFVQDVWRGVTVTFLKMTTTDTWTKDIMSKKTNMHKDTTDLLSSSSRN